MNENIVNTLQNGATTIEYVLLTFGEPDYVSDDGNCLTYTWGKIKLVWILGGYSGATGGAVDRKYDLVLCFDDQGLVVRKDFKKDYSAE